MKRDPRASPPAARLAFLLALVTGISFGACARPSPPDIVLVVIDSLRADHLGAYGYGRPTSPNIDRLAATGTLFLEARAPSSWTKPSIASLFTSRHPSEHGAVSFQHQLSSELPTLAEKLHATGYETLGISGNFVHLTEANGFSRGFDVWSGLGEVADAASGDSLFTTVTPDGKSHESRAPTAREINERARRALLSRSGRPLFLYVHYMEPHPGFDPPPDHRSRFLRNPRHHATAPAATAGYVSALARDRARPGRDEVDRLIDLYDAEIASVDEALGDLLRMLSELGVAQPVVVVVADHGEEFLDHGGWFHGLHLHREVLRVPFVLRDPRSAHEPREVAELVDLIDVAPTLLSLAGAPALVGQRGRDLLQRNGATRSRDLVAELHRDPLLEAHLGARTQRFAVERGPRKLIAHFDGSSELYRTDRDAGEIDPLDEPMGELRKELAAAGDALWRPAELAGTSLEDHDDLRALGYVE